MRIQKGDIVFGPRGRPGVVIGRDEISRNLLVENQGELYEKTRHYGFINGLKPEERAKYTAIVDGIREIKDPADQVEALRVKLEELEQDPRNLQLTRYLRAEQAHIMHNFNVKPRVYTMDEETIV